MSDMTQEDLIAFDNSSKEENKEEKKTATKKAAASTKSRKSVPNGYIEVKLDSLGKLGYPDRLHFRNYSMSEALDLASANEDDFLERLLAALNGMVFEDFDCAELHEKDLEEVLMNIYTGFWGKTFEGFSYYIDNTIEDEEKKNAKENISVASIPIANIETNPIRDDFQEPIVIKKGDSSVGFRLPRIKDALTAKQIINESFKERDRKMSDIKVRYERAVKKGEEPNSEDAEAYDIYMRERNREYFRVYQSQLIETLDGEWLELPEAKLDAMDRVGFEFWKRFNQVVKDVVDFGINRNVTFPDSISGNLITRRFRFRFLDFLPTLDSIDDSELDVSFGA